MNKDNLKVALIQIKEGKICDFLDNALLFCFKAIQRKKTLTTVLLPEKTLLKFIRFQDHIQDSSGAKNKALRIFVFHSDIEYNEYDVDRKNLNYNSTVNNRYNVAPYSNDKDRDLYFKPVYSFWIVVHPAKMRQGKIYHFNSGMEGETFEEDGQIRFSKHIESTIPLENYRIFLDRNLSQRLKEIPNLQGLLQPFYKEFNITEFKSYLKTYDLVKSQNYMREAITVNRGIIAQSFYDTGFDEARNRVINNLLKSKDCLTKEEAEIKADLLLTEIEPVKVDD